MKYWVFVKSFFQTFLLLVTIFLSAYVATNYNQPLGFLGWFAVTMMVITVFSIAFIDYYLSKN
jgi:hypothetical protein|tara:strand:+ start:253 stop:441 length:189 start_codon:yes stop_codon:yes gene_type:complete